jgi:5-methylcytosine-specific restriction endonuclease McrA
MNTPTKRCTLCGESFLATNEYFHRSFSAKDGLQSRCKECARRVAREDAAAHREEAKQRAHDWYHANKERGKTTRKQWSEQNKDRVKANRKRYLAENGEKLRAKKRQDREQNPDHIRMLARMSYQKHRDIRIAGVRRYQAENRERRNEQMRAGTIRRRARIMNASGNHNSADIKKQYAIQHGCCFWCSTPVGRTYQVDHVMPLSRGGSNWPDNIVIACPICNRDKWDKIPYTEWTPPNPLT